MSRNRKANEDAGRRLDVAMHESLERRAFLKKAAAVVIGATAAARIVTGGSARAQALPVEERIRIAVVLPGTTGTVVVDEALYDIAGDAARVAASIVDSDVGGVADAEGLRYRMLMGHAPDDDTAYRTGERMVAVEETAVLIGGIGVGQADALARVAQERGVLFLNVGDPSNTLRATGGPNVFHVEPSWSMYVDALVDWHARAGRRRWFVVHDEEQGAEAVERTRTAAANLGMGGTVVGSARVAYGQPTYYEELQSIQDSDADVVLLSVHPRDEIQLRYELENVRSVQAIAAVPNVVSQTRDFIAASRVPDRDGRHDERILAWETTLRNGPAGELNERFTSRTGQPADSTVWTTYEAVTAYFQAVRDVGTVDPNVVRERLIDDDFTFASAKGAGTSFRGWDRQLRQPLYVSRVDHEARWGASLTRRIEVAALHAILPDDASPDRTTLDRYGDGPERAED